MYYDDTSDDEDPLPVQSLESFTVNNNQEQNNDYSTCILVDLVDRKIQTCGCSQQIRPLNHLIGMWQLDKEIVKKNEEEGKKLGICMQHFNVDQKYHKNKLKTTIPVIDKNIQVSCNGQITCHALNNFGVICKPEVDIVAKAQYICCECYQNHGGHLHVKMGSGKPLFDCEKFGLHNNDHSTSLDLLGKWLLTVAKSENIEYKEKVLMNILNPALQIIKETQEMEAKNSSSKAVIEISTISDLLYTKVPSPFVLKVFLKMHKINLEDTNSFSLNEQSKTFGQNMAKALWNSRTMLLEQKNKIKMPDSLDEYYNALPPFLTLWFPQVMASLSRRPRLLGSMRDLFSTLQIMAHTSGNERKLEIERMSRIQPEIRLKKNDPKIWNLSMIDNIDFKEKSFTYYNIFNATRNTSHATLRMCFQIPLSFNTQEGPEDILQNISEKDLFGMNNVAE
ncbi:11397_t:CDS:2, partial [Entrophospora sp. SA101]